MTWLSQGTTNEKIRAKVVFQRYLQAIALTRVYICVWQTICVYKTIVANDVNAHYFHAWVAMQREFAPFIKSLDVQCQLAEI